VTVVFSRTSRPSRANASDSSCAASRSSRGRNKGVLHDGDLRAQATERLGQFAAEWTAADHQQARRQCGEIEDVFVGEVARLLQAGNVRDARPCAGGDQRLVDAQGFIADTQLVGCLEAGVAEEHVHTGRDQPLRGVVATKMRADTPDAFHRAGKIHR